MKPYKYYSGIKDIAQELQGDEHIYLGIRPYGFHAANAMVLVCYPIFLCEAMQERGIEPKFNIHVFINDWEQDRLEGINGIDIKKYPFNVMPKKTTFQFTPDPELEHMNIVDRWQPIIEKDVNKIKALFPGVSTSFHRNSELKNLPVMKEVLLKTLKHPHVVADVLRDYSKHDIIGSDVMYAQAVCNKCLSARGNTSVDENDTITLHCGECGTTKSGAYEEFDYWFYHKPLALPRIKAFDIDLCITGLEHYHEGDFDVRGELIKAYDLEVKPFRTLYAPLICAEDGRPMGKSKGNAKYVPIDELLTILRNNDNPEIIV